MANNNIGSEWNNNQNDFQVADFNAHNNGNTSKNQLVNRKQTLIEFLSDVQRMSVMEAVSEDDFDKDLFTIKESLYGFNHGFKLGIYANIFLFIHLIIAFLFSFDNIINSFQSKILQYFIYYIPAFVIIISTLYISTLSKLAVGEYTNKAIKTFFMGKFLGSLIVGIIVLVTTSYLFDLASANLEYILTLNISYFGYGSQDLYKALIVFLSHKNIIYFELSILLFTSTILPFTIYGLRKYFFSINNQSAYEEY